MLVRIGEQGKRSSLLKEQSDLGLKYLSRSIFWAAIVYFFRTIIVT